ncbi:MAG TPA: twin-arginine translocase subunit TatC [Bacteroidia bacterium]|nr:twin-arginine translocase subunit TatC [Bacteroidia bacterium]
MFERIKKALNPNGEMSFLAHLETLRWHLMRSVIVVSILGIVMFVYQKFLFGTVLFGPKNPNFITYRILCKIGARLNMPELCIHKIPIQLINTELAGQLTMSMWVAFVAGLILGMPYVLWELWLFIKPALKQKEIKGAKGFVFFATLLFLIGASFSYFLIVPWTINFLGNYSISGSDVSNMITIDSYISTVTSLVFLLGLVFELPIIVYFLTKFGILSPAFMRKYRRHAVIVVLIGAAFISPPDVTSQMVVAVPLYLLFELSIFVSVFAQKRKKPI